MPEISVLMSVYNTDIRVLKEAVDSIINQTFTDWEMILINDASTSDDTIKFLNGLQDERIILVNNDVNLGLTKSLNKGLELCKGNYVARMDADDVSLPQRFEKQLAYIQKTGNIVVGSYFGLIPAKKFKRFYTEDIEKQKCRMIFGNDGIVHSSAFWNRNEFEIRGIRYNEKYAKSQDYALWCECLSKGVKIGICPEKLVLWRESENQITRKCSNEQKKAKNEIREEFIISNFNIDSNKVSDLIRYTKEDFYNDDGFNNKKNYLIIRKFVDEFVKCNIYTQKNIKKEIERFYIFQALLRVKRYRKYDLLFSGLFSLTSIMYYVKSIFFELHFF